MLKTTGSNDTKIFHYITLGFGIIGIGFLGGAWLSYRATTSFLERSIATTGTVVANQMERDSDGDRFYYPVVEFKTNEGEKFKFISNVGSNPSSHAVGSEIEILYNPANPQSAEVNSFILLWLLTILLSIMGIGFSGIGFFSFFQLLRGKI